MTTVQLLKESERPAPDFIARLDRINQMFELFLRDQLDIPETLNFNQVLILGRMATTALPIRPIDLLQQGWYPGKNVAYNVQSLVKQKYLTIKKGANKRNRWLELTPHGRTLGEEVAERIAYVEREMGAVFPDEAFKAIVAFLGATGHPPSPASVVQSRKVERA